MSVGEAYADSILFRVFHGESQDKAKKMLSVLRDSDSVTKYVEKSGLDALPVLCSSLLGLSRGGILEREEGLEHVVSFAAASAGLGEEFVKLYGVFIGLPRLNFKDIARLLEESELKSLTAGLSTAYGVVAERNAGKTPTNRST